MLITWEFNDIGWQHQVVGFGPPISWNAKSLDSSTCKRQIVFRVWVHFNPFSTIQISLFSSSFQTHEMSLELRLNRTTPPVNLSSPSARASTLCMSKWFVGTSNSNMRGLDMEIEIKATLAFCPLDNFAIGLRWSWPRSPNFLCFARTVSSLPTPSCSGWSRRRQWTGVSSAVNKSTKRCEYLPILSFWLFRDSSSVGAKSPARRFNRVDFSAPLVQQ